MFLSAFLTTGISAKYKLVDSTVKLGIKELLKKEQTGFKEFFTD